MVRKKASKKKVQKKVFSKKVQKKGMNSKILPIGIVVVVILLLVGVFLYFSGDEEIGFSPDDGAEREIPPIPALPGSSSDDDEEDDDDSGDGDDVVDGDANGDDDVDDDVDDDGEGDGDGDGDDSVDADDEDEFDFDEDEPEEIPTPEIISECGVDQCLFDSGKCYKSEKRKERKNNDLVYCDGGKSEFVLAKGIGDSCTENYECESNLCRKVKCTRAGIFKEILEWLRDWFR